MTQEQQFISVPTLIKGAFRLVEGPNAPQFCQGINSAGALVLSEDLISRSRLPESLLAFLVEMDRKLDTILGHMQRGTLTSDFPLEGHIVSISGSGLTFETETVLSVGEHMELLIFLEEFPLRVCSVMARVEKTVTKTVTGGDKKAFELRFVHLQEEDREAIIRFVFREERKRIRAQKGE